MNPPRSALRLFRTPPRRSEPRAHPARGRAPEVALALGLASALLPDAYGQPHGFSGHAFGGFGPAPVAQSVTDLRFTDFDPAKADGLRKELRILSRVFERLIRRPDTERNNASRMGIPMLLTPAEPSVRITHLEGFGILLSLETDLLLVPTPASQNAPRPGVPDSEWEAARRELDGEAAAENHPVAHDPDRVLEFRRQLIGALRQATNLHHLAPGDVVAVIATGPAGSAAAREPQTEGSTSPAGAGTTAHADAPAPGSENLPPGREHEISGGTTAGGGGSFGFFSSSSSSGSGLPPGFGNRMWDYGVAGSPQAQGSVPDEASFLTLRVTKADLDQLAQGKLSPETFASKLTVNAYQGPRATTSSTERVF